MLDSIPCKRHIQSLLTLRGTEKNTDILFTFCKEQSKSWLLLSLLLGVVETASVCWKENPECLSLDFGTGGRNLCPRNKL